VTAASLQVVDLYRTKYGDAADVAPDILETVPAATFAPLT
jgi:hypothetical protein